MGSRVEVEALALGNSRELVGGEELLNVLRKIIAALRVQRVWVSDAFGGVQRRTPWARLTASRRALHHRKLVLEGERPGLPNMFYPFWPGIRTSMPSRSL